MSSPVGVETIEEVEHAEIPMRDGANLSARLFLPRTAHNAPVPAILEFIPYRKRDLMRARDEPIHRYFALHGYASVRVDVRGTGDSEGIFEDEYSVQEGRDAVEVIAWVAAQPWCSGAVGMMGISWGGFNSLQVAALKPPALRAVISLCAADDRYTDDAHYMGGCLLNENMQWGTILTMYASYPPDPHIVGERWREMWRERLRAVRPFPAVWMQHLHRDAFWKHGSVAEDYSAIEVPVYAVGGWADAYSNAIPRLLEHLSVPRKGLIGPWAHTFPHDGAPGPAIGFLQEALRWWDQWLAGRDTGIMDEPMLRAWMQSSVTPKPQYDERPGRWIAEETWPSPNVREHAYHLDVGHLSTVPNHDQTLSFSSPCSTGIRGGEWCAFGADGEMPRDQRADDGGSLSFDSDPLTEVVEIFGAPVVELELTVDQPTAMLAARLCDVAPDGSSLRVSYGLLNLCHRNGHESPEAMEPGRRTRIRLQLNDIAHSFPPGHRLRLSLSTGYWPIAWTSPRPVRVQIHTGGSAFTLPTRAQRPADDALPPFEPPTAAPGSTHRKLIHLPMRRTIEQDLTSNEFVYTLKSDGGELDGAARAYIEEIDLEIGSQLMKRYRIIEDDPLSPITELFIRTEFGRDDWSVRLVCRSKLSSTEEHFQFSCDLEAFENGVPFEERNWTIAIPRKML